MKNALMPALPSVVKANAIKVEAARAKQQEHETKARNPLAIKKDYGKGSRVNKERSRKVNAALDKYVYGGGTVGGKLSSVPSQQADTEQAEQMAQHEHKYASTITLIITLAPTSTLTLPPTLGMCHAAR